MSLLLRPKHNAIARTCLPVPNVDVQVVAATDKRVSGRCESYSIDTTFVTLEFFVKLKPSDQVHTLTELLLKLRWTACAAQALSIPDASEHERV